MKVHNYALVSAAAACLLSCGHEVVDVSMDGFSGNDVATGTDSSGKTAANYRPGSGIYGPDCEASAGRYAIILGEGEDGHVSAQVTVDSGPFKDLLTSYSFMGDATPSDFLVAILFDREGAPVPDAVYPRIEIWKEKNAFYALVNGNEDKRLEYCADISG